MSIPEIQDRRRVLIVQHSTSRDGSATSGLLIADGLKKTGWSTFVAFGHPGEMAEEYALKGHEVIVIPHKNWLRRSRWISFIKDVFQEWRNAWAFADHIRVVQPDVVYVNSVVSLAGVLGARRAGVPCVWHLRELFSEIGGEMQAPRIFRPLIRMLLRSLPDQIVVNSRIVAANLLGGMAPNVHVVPNAVPDAYFEELPVSAGQARRQFGLAESGKIIIGVPGTLRPAKGHSFFFRSLKQLPVALLDQIQIAVTGGGEEAYVARLKDQVRELGLGGQIIFTGPVSDMLFFYKACDLVVVPSQAESFGRTIIEAFACGVPVIATNVGGIPEIIAPAETGLLVEYGDEAGMAAAMQQVMNDAGLKGTVTWNARLQAAEEYTAFRYGKRILKIVKEVAGRPRSF